MDSNSTNSSSELIIKTLALESIRSKYLLTAAIALAVFLFMFFYVTSLFLIAVSHVICIYFIFRAILCELIYNVSLHVLKREYKKDRMGAIDKALYSELFLK